MVPPETVRQSPLAAIVTGASVRIGSAIAHILATNGTNIVVHYLDSDNEAEALCDDLRKHQVEAIAIKADLTNSNDTRDLFGKAVDAFGTIDLLVNNASIFEPDSLLEPNDDLWADHFAIHLQAPTILAGEMAKQKDLSNGLIVNMIDQRVLNLNPLFFSYTLSKSALWTATQTMAQALAPKIRVNGIGPGPTLPNQRQSDDDFKKQTDALLLQQTPDLSEFGDTILWMWRAQSFTGQLVNLDGGQHLGWKTPDVHGVKE